MNASIQKYLTNQNDIYHMKRILTILAAIICLCSCEKQGRPHWLYNMWSGEYNITMTNNDTGEHEPHVAGISLEFSDDRSKLQSFALVDVIKGLLIGPLLHLKFKCKIHKAMICLTQPTIILG